MMMQIKLTEAGWLLHVEEEATEDLFFRIGLMYRTMRPWLPPRFQINGLAIIEAGDALDRLADLD
jgi:hypothetical protein